MCFHNYFFKEVITIANYGTQEIKCPFYQRETQTALVCEGIVTEHCLNEFYGETQKDGHKNEYCETYSFNNCPLYRGLMLKYGTDPDGLTGPWIETLLLNYSEAEPEGIFVITNRARSKKQKP